MVRSVLVVGLLLCVGACQATQQEKQDAADADTVSEGQRRPAVDPGPAPGTARVRVTVRDCRLHAASDYRCQIEVREVVAYGASTPVLDAGQDVEVRIPAEGMRSRAERWPERGEMEMTLSHARQPAPQDTPTPVWVLEVVHEK